MPDRYDATEGALHAAWDESAELVITARRRGAAAADAVERDLAALPRLRIARSADADLAISGELGRGGSGVVWLASQRGLHRDVAVKSLLPERRHEPRAIAALLTEGYVLGALEHPNIVPIHALCRDQDGSPALVMKRISGVRWRALLGNPEHPAWPRDARDQLAFHLETLARVCDAVHFAHSRGILHRDIKTDNVMIGAFGEVYLLDWGLAYCKATVNGLDSTLVGTLGYMAPEMIDGTGPHLGPWTDIYLLGATLHEVLTGSPRHAGTTLLQVLGNAHASLPFAYPPEVPEALALLCNQATSRDPSARPASAMAFRQALDAFLQHRRAMGSREGR